MENSDEYIDVDSNEVHSTDDDTAGVKLNDEEDDIYSVSSGSESSNDSDDADKGNDDKPVEVDAVVGDRVVNVNSITSDEIFALEFGTVDEAFEFYYRYGKCKGFAARKSDRRKDPKGSKKLVMRQFVCNKHGYRDKKHLCKTDRKREHRRLTRTGCTARLRVQYKPKKDRYVVSIFEEGHNHELTPSKYVHLHPIYRQISEADRAQIDGLQSHGFRTCHIMGYMVAQKGGYADVKSSTDAMLYAEYAVNESDGRMKSLFWADGAEIFKEVKEQITKAGALIVKDKHVNGDTKVYTLTKYCKDNYEREVVYDGSTLNCSCKLFDSRGLPCSHIFYVMKEEHVDHIPRSLVLPRWTKDAKIEYLTNDGNGTVDSNMMVLARFGAYCSVFTNFCKEVSKKDGVYEEVIDDIMNLQKKYCSTDDPIGTQKSTVRDPVPVKGRGAPKKRKTDTKTIRRGGRCDNTTHNARSCSRAKKAPVGKNVKLDSMSLTDFVSQTEKNKKRKTSCKGEPSVQKNCSDGPQNRGDNVTMRQIPSMYAVQPMMPVIHPGGHPMQVQPVYPIYGMPVGENSNSCFGLLQQVMKSAGKE
ncbi:hypothetical protein P8452_67699 [Trifolium repens]|nr:hypothetical protein P8452_67699 [Trifolium repens]